MPLACFGRSSRHLLQLMWLLISVWCVNPELSQTQAWSQVFTTAHWTFRLLSIEVRFLVPIYINVQQCNFKSKRIPNDSSMWRHIHTPVHELVVYKHISSFLMNNYINWCFSLLVKHLYSSCLTLSMRLPFSVECNERYKLNNSWNTRYNLRTVASAINSNTYFLFFLELLHLENEQFC